MGSLKISGEAALNCRLAPVLILAMGTMGTIFVISQVLVLQEFLQVFQGNEFSIGIVLGSWLLLEALGSWMSGRRAGRSRDPLSSFVVLQGAQALLLPATLVMIRTGRFLLGASPWEALSFQSIWVLSFLILMPLGLANGAAFVYGCRLVGAGDNNRLQGPGKVYALEAAGAFIGALAFTFLLIGRLHAMEIAFCLGVLNMCCAFLLLHRFRERPRTREPYKIVTLLIMVLFIVGLFLPWADGIHWWTWQCRWSPLQLKESAESVYGNITVLTLGEERILYQNGLPAITMPFPDIAALEELVHLPLLAHADPKELLFVGGGVGGALAEAQKHPVQGLSYTELDPLLVRTAQQYATPLVTSELADGRTRIIYQDGRLFLRKTKKQYDVIIIHLPDASTLQLNRFFTLEFFSLAARHLAPQGILAFSLPGSDAYLSEEMIRMNRCVWDTLKAVFSHVRALPGGRNLFLASQDVALASLGPSRLAERLEARAVNSSVVRPFYLNYKMNPLQEQWLKETIFAGPPSRLNQDFSPALLFYFLAYVNAEVQPELRRVVLALEKINFKGLFIGLTVLNLPFVLFVLRRKAKRVSALSFSIFSTGLVGMAIEMVVIFVFQSVYGYLYHWIGFLIAAFMAGLALGAFLMTHRQTGFSKGYLFFGLIELVLFGFVIITALGLTAGNSFLLRETIGAGTLPGVFFIINLLAGSLVGCEFPLANQEAGRNAKDGTAGRAGRFYALDLSGAWLGTMLVSVLFVPLIGIEHTLWLVGALKAWSLVYLFLAR